MTAAARDDNPNYVSHADLLRMALREHCKSIETEPVLALCRPREELLGVQGHGLSNLPNAVASSVTATPIPAMSLL